MSPPRLGAAAILCWLLTAPPLAASEPTHHHLAGIPVDQAVGDLDALSRGIRQVQWGMALRGQDTNLLEIRNPQPQPWADRPWLFDRPMAEEHRKLYYRIGPGYRARIFRSDYYIPVDPDNDIYQRNVPPKRERQFIEAVPADTVYELGDKPMFIPGSPDPDAHERPRPAERIVAPGQIGATLIHGRIDGRVRAQFDARVEADTP